MLLSVIWTVFRTKEYPPEEYCEQNGLDFEALTRNHKEKKTVGEKLRNFIHLFTQMPPMMVKLAIVQFFSWFALYLMWVYTTPAVAQHVYGAAIGDSPAACNSVGICKQTRGKEI